MMTIAEAYEYYESLGGFTPRTLKPGEQPFDLAPLRMLLLYLGSPETRLRFVHAAGTNGKGSFCTFLHEIMTAAGYRTGLFMSPALGDVTEEIRAGGTAIPKEAFAAVLSEIREASERMLSNGLPTPSRFEVLTAAALLWFRRTACELVILETGLGGRLDATNVIPPPLLSVFTPISYDHMETLGSTLTAITLEKAGILKRGTRALSARQPREAGTALRARCRKLGVPLEETDNPVILSGSLSGQSFRTAPQSAGAEAPVWRIPLTAPYQCVNAALAVRAAELLRSRDFYIPDTAIAEGLLKTRRPARFELLHRSPFVILDGSHNAAGASALREALSARFPEKRITFITGVLADKDYPAIFDEILPVAERFFTLQPDSPRALPAEALAQYLRDRRAEARACKSASDALSQALSETSKEDVICVFGSLYLTESVRRAMPQP